MHIVFRLEGSARQGVGVMYSISGVLQEYQGSLWIQPSSPLRLEGEESLQISVSSSKSATLCTSGIFHHSFTEEKWGYQKELVTSSALHTWPTSYHYNLSRSASSVQGDTYKVKVTDQNRGGGLRHTTGRVIGISCAHCTFIQSYTNHNNELFSIQHLNDLSPLHRTVKRLIVLYPDDFS